MAQTRTLAALQIAQSHLDAGNTSADVAHKLVDEARDVLAPALDKQVSVQDTLFVSVLELMHSVIVWIYCNGPCCFAITSHILGKPFL